MLAARERERTESTAYDQIVFPIGLAALIVYSGFEAGGYFADTTGWIAVAVACALGLSAIVLGRPPQGLTPPLLIGAAALALFAIWTLLSGEWSGSRARALIEFDRALLYLLILLLFGSVSRPRETLHSLATAVALGAVVVCGAGVLIRTLPDAWPFALPELTSRRMDYPVSYENALGALAGLGLVFSLHLASSTERLAATRVLAAASVPLLTAALVLTLSRGAILATSVGLLAYLLLGFSRGLVGALLATLPAAAVAAVGAYNADLLATLRARTPPALEQGDELALLLAAAVLGAGVLLALLIPLERRLARISLKGPRRIALVALPVVAVAAVLLASGAGGQLDSLREDFLESNEREGEPPARSRLGNPGVVTDIGGQNRVKYWQVGLDAFADEPVRGNGAGTFARLWARDRPISEDLTEGHSLYVEVLAELGVIGASLLLICLGTIVVALLMGLRGPRRPLYAAMVAATVLWLVHAGVDWDWEMPVLTLWLFAVGGCALAASRRGVRLRRRYRSLAGVAVGVGCLLVAVTPAAVALSQGRLDRSVEALQEGDCLQAERAALGVISMSSARPEPYAILSICDIRRGDTVLAVDRMHQALERDPESWQLFYTLALVRGAGGLDPRPAAKMAYRLNPREELTTRALESLSTGRPRVWRREARALPLPIVVD